MIGRLFQEIIARLRFIANPWLGVLTLAATVVMAAGSDEHHAVAPQTNEVIVAAATNAVAHAAAKPDLVENPSLDEVNPALRHRAEPLKTSNLVVAVAIVQTNSDAQAYQARLDMALQFHREKNTAQAKLILVELLHNDAPTDIKRNALLELAMVAQDENQPARALQIFSQYVSRYGHDVSIPEVLLRQGLLYRQMGANSLAVSKFYGVMSAALSLKTSDLRYHRRIVLQAQTEIADTYYQQGSYAESAEFLQRILKLDSSELNQALIRFKLIRSRAALGLHAETVQAGRSYLDAYPGAPERSEVRFLVAKSLKALSQNDAALKELSLLLKEQQEGGAEQKATWIYWQQRIGNEIANQLYRDGDFMNALHLYQTLVTLDDSPAWRLPVLYQIALVYERLLQPAKAIETYDAITATKEGAPDPSPELKTVLGMAKWRSDLLKWQSQIHAPPSTNAVLQSAQASTSKS